MRPGLMATQITFVGGERIGIVQPLDTVVQSLTRESATSPVSLI